jgi:uncharacterized protein YndB with AHSA1/START domain
MSGKWERKFDFTVSVERVWRALTDPDESLLLFHEQPEFLEKDPGKKLSWSQDVDHLPDRGEFTVVFESLDNGSRITVTRFSFGEGDDADIFAQSQEDGWQRGFMDLVLYLETGVSTKRIVPEGGGSRTGMGFMARHAGIQILTVTPGSFGEEAGLTRGDWVSRIGGTPIYSRADVWMINQVHSPGTELEVEFVRNGELLTRKAKLSDRSASAWGE